LREALGRGGALVKCDCSVGQEGLNPGCKAEGVPGLCYPLGHAPRLDGREGLFNV